MKAFGAACLAAVMAAGCGYHVAGHADLLPERIKTIAIPLPAAITREFISRTRYRIVADPEKADAVLHGGVVNYLSYPTIFDPATGRAAGIQLIVVLDLRLIDRRTGKMLYQNSGMNVQNRYEISSDQVAYFEESDTALDRLSRDVARTVVSAILENF